MAVKSMTGFGRGRAVAAGLAVEVEVSSVNRKQLDIRANLPRGLGHCESLLHEPIQSVISRGQVNVSVQVRVVGGRSHAGFRIDRSVAAAGLREIRALARTLKLQEDGTLAQVLQMPNVIRPDDPLADTAALEGLLVKALQTALLQHGRMRQREGQVLARDLQGRLGHLRRALKTIQACAPGVTTRYRRTLLERLEQAEVGVNVDDPQVLREIALFADRCDISEEITRLDSHLAQAARNLAAREPVGRALDFLVQEMFREVNTIGSKGNDLVIAQQVIEAKTELERIREQVQNLE
jgi:uncharacterized protein (TIGR00255 family)